MSTTVEDDVRTRRPTALAGLLVIGGAIGLVAAFVLTIDKLKILENPDFVPSCDFGSILSCSSIMKSEQAELFGFPNPLLGLVGFSVVITLGVALLTGAVFAEWLWAGLQIGTLAGLVFTHWLAYQSLYEIGFLCPYCMLVWAVMIPIFFYVSLRNLRAWAPAGKVTAFVGNWHILIVVLWILVIGGAVLIRFWDNFAAAL